MKVQYKDEQTKMRYKLREHNKGLREKRLSKLTPEERLRRIEYEQRKSETRWLREEEYYQDVLKAEGVTELPVEQEIFLRKMIRHDVKEMVRIERRENGEQSEGEWDPWDEDNRMEDKLIYGSSSEDEVIDEVMQR